MLSTNWFMSGGEKYFQGQQIKMGSLMPPFFTATTKWKLVILKRRIILSLISYKCFQKTSPRKQPNLYKFLFSYLLLHGKLVAYNGDVLCSILWYFSSVFTISAGFSILLVYFIGIVFWTHLYQYNGNEGSFNLIWSGSLFCWSYVYILCVLDICNQYWNYAFVGRHFLLISFAFQCCCYLMYRLVKFKCWQNHTG